MTQDEHHLQLLAIFHFVVAGITALFSLFPVIHLTVGFAILSGALDPANGDEIPTFFGWFMVLLAGTFIILGLGFASLIALAGRALQRRQSYTFCLVVGALSCLMMPFGTVLGVFTIIVLMRESVREIFGQRPRNTGAAV